MQSLKSVESNQIPREFSNVSVVYRPVEFAVNGSSITQPFVCSRLRRGFEGLRNVYACSESILECYIPNRTQALLVCVRQKSPHFPSCGRKGEQFRNSSLVMLGFRAESIFQRVVNQSTVIANFGIRRIHLNLSQWPENTNESVACSHTVIQRQLVATPKSKVLFSREPG